MRVSEITNKRYFDIAYTVLNLFGKYLYIDCICKQNTRSNTVVEQLVDQTSSFIDRREI